MSVFCQSACTSRLIRRDVDVARRNTLLVAGEEKTTRCFQRGSWRAGSRTRYGGSGKKWEGNPWVVYNAGCATRWERARGATQASHPLPTPLPPLRVQG